MGHWKNGEYNMFRNLLSILTFIESKTGTLTHEPTLLLQTQTPHSLLQDVTYRRFTLTRHPTRQSKIR